MRDETLALLDEFAAAWARGETPDPRELVARAPEGEREELTRALDRYLSGSPPRPASDASRKFVAAIALEAESAAEPPLLALRLERRLTRDAVVDGLMSRLGLDPAKRAKVRRYFSDLEVGVLDPKGVAPELWNALRTVLSVDSSGEWLARKVTGVSLSAPVYHRMADRPELAARLSQPSPRTGRARGAGRGRSTLYLRRLIVDDRRVCGEHVTRTRARTPSASDTSTSSAAPSCRSLSRRSPRTSSACASSRAGSSATAPACCCPLSGVILLNAAEAKHRGRSADPPSPLHDCA